MRILQAETEISNIAANSSYSYPSAYFNSSKARSSSSSVSNISSKSSFRPSGTDGPLRLLRLPLGLRSDVFVPLPPPAAPPHRKTRLHGNGVYPSGILRTSRKTAAMQKQPEEDLLCGVGRVLFVVHQPETDPPHARAEPLHQRDKRRAVGTFSGGLGGKLFVGAMNQINGHRRPHSVLRQGFLTFGCRKRRIRHKRPFYPDAMAGNKADRHQKSVTIGPTATGGPRNMGLLAEIGCLAKKQHDPSSIGSLDRTRNPYLR